MSLIGLPALAIVALGVMFLASVAVRIGAPDTRPFVKTVWWAVFAAEIARAAGILAAVGGFVA